jgi:hypothetical protein
VGRPGADPHGRLQLKWTAAVADRVWGTRGEPLFLGEFGVHRPTRANHELIELFKRKLGNHLQ